MASLIPLGINAFAIFLHAFSWIISVGVLILIICRFKSNRTIHQLRSLAHSSNTSIFDDNISLFLIGNTYLIVIVLNSTWVIMTFNTLTADMGLENNLVYHENSFVCHGLVAMIFALTSALYHSFLLQASWCCLKIVFHAKLSTMKICCLPLNGLMTYIFFTIVTWIISVIVVIPAYTHFDLFVYIPDLFQCMIPFTKFSGFLYALFSTYIIPINIIIIVYLKIVQFIRRLPNRHTKRRAKRQVAVVQHVLVVCGFLSLGGSPTVAFIAQYRLTGRLHPLADRIHELALAIGINSISVGFAVLNSYHQLWRRRYRSIKKDFVRS